MFSLNYITLIPFSCWFPAVFLVFHIQNYFTMFMNLLNDQIWTMLLDDALTNALLASEELGTMQRSLAH